MKSFFNLILCASVCLSVPIPEADPIAESYASDYTYYLPADNPSSQFHAQDDVGQYNYGYQSADQTKNEIKTADGVVRGSYSYVDANGLVQTTNYISDALGFRVAATNLPVHAVDGVAAVEAAPVAAVAAAPIAAVEAAPVAAVQAAPVATVAAVQAAPVAAVAAVQAAPVAAVASPAPVAAAAVPVPAVHNTVMTPSVSYAYLPYATNYDYHVVPTQYVKAAPAASLTVAHSAPVAATQVAPVAVTHSAPVAVAQAAPVAVAQAAPVAVAPVAVPAAAPTSSQYHAQDELGQYSFGYNDANSVRQETKTADGAVTGAYRYVDSNGKIQTVQYIADAAGFRVSASNLPVFAAQAPVDTPEVAAAKVQHAQAYSAAQVVAAEAAALEPVVVADPLPIAEVAAVPEESEAQTYFGAAAVYNQAAPVVAAPVVQAAPIAVAPVVKAAPVVQAATVAVAPAVQTAPVAAEQYFGAAEVYNQVVPVANVAPVVPAAPVIQAAPAVAPAAASSQYHSQDDLGQYTFGYSDANSVKQEVKTADGIVRGSYSYVDGDGIIQSVNYIADALGFRVGATNLPVHAVDAAPVAVPTVEAAPVAVSAVAAEAPAAAPVEVAYDAQPVAAPAASVISPLISYSYLPYATNYGYNLPAVQAAPVVKAAPAVAVEASPVVEESVPAVTVNAVPVAAAAAPVPNDVSSQYHAQDELGQYNYGYSSATQTKSELKTADGITRGSYSYIDANGIVQTVNYISDAMGFRVAATNLPVHQVDAEAAAVAPAVEAAEYNVLTPNVNYAYLPYAQNYAYSSPAAAA